MFLEFSQIIIVSFFSDNSLNVIKKMSEKRLFLAHFINLLFRFAQA